MNINININNPQIEEILQSLKRMENQMSLISDKIDAIFAEIDNDSNIIKTELDTLILQVANGTMTPDEIQAKAQPVLDKLAALGTEYVNPVPA